MRGTMLWFNETKDTGFLTSETGERLPLQGSGFVDGQKPQGRCRDAEVTFRVTEDNEGRRAEEVAFVPDIAPRRARRRTSHRW